MSFQLKDCIGLELSGRYVVREKLGDGGMGTVYRAYDRNLRADVVIKVPHPAMFQQEAFAQRFAREIRSLVALTHPHIVRLSDVGEHQGLPFAVMQYLAGGSLEDRRPRDARGGYRPVRADELENWLLQIASALDFIHGRGLVHRDVKPANILFDEDGNAYLSDFGIAKTLGTQTNSHGTATLTGTGLVIGTPEYMAPELISGEPYDGRADQYALAATVYEVLCGRRPFEAATPAAVLIKHATQSPPDVAAFNSAIPEETARAIRKGLSKQPHERFANCYAFTTALTETAGNRPTDNKARQHVPRRSRQHFATEAANHPGFDTDEFPQIKIATSPVARAVKKGHEKTKGGIFSAVWEFIWLDFDSALVRITGEQNTLLQKLLRWGLPLGYIVIFLCVIVYLFF